MRIDRRGPTVLLLVVALAGACTPRPAGPNDPYRDPRIGVGDWRRLFESPGRGEIL